MEQLAPVEPRPVMQPDQPDLPQPVAAVTTNRQPLARAMPRADTTATPQAAPSASSPGTQATGPNPEAGPGGDGGDDISRPLPGGGPGFIPGLPGQGPVWKVPGVLPDRGRRAAAPTKAPKRKYDKRAATKIIQRGVRKKDSKLGLDFPAASAIAATLRNAVRAADTPYQCSASFSVMVNRSGKVTAVNLNGFTGGNSSTWQHVRKTALAALKSRTFPLKSGFPKGAHVAVSVRSQKKMPGGGTGRKGATLSFDVTDIGAKPTRVVTVGFSATPVK